MADAITSYYTVVFQPLFICFHNKKKTYPFSDYRIHRITMPRDEVDPSTITNGPRKRTLSSYVRDQDNISGDRDQYVKRIKQTVNPGVFVNKSYSLPLFYSIKTFRQSFQVCKRSQ